jgi:glycosyltransferase involved in cell wall biosynthesis
LENELQTNFYVISCGRNAGRFALKNLNSIHNQNIKPKKHFYIDDASDDSTPSIVNEWLKNNEQNVVHFQQNDIRLYKTHHLYNTIHNINDEDGVVVIVDGDDWLHTPLALQIISNEYEKNPSLEYVYSNWMYSHNKELGLCKPIPNENWNPYKNEWITSHLTTFRVKAYKRINAANFKDANGNFFITANDQACNLSIIASSKLIHGNYDRVKFINLPLYVYQYAENNESIRKGLEGREYMNFQHETAQFIRKRGFIP